jgi:hypothetical protein
MLGGAQALVARHGARVVAVLFDSRGVKFSRGCVRGVPLSLTLNHTCLTVKVVSSSLQIGRPPAPDRLHHVLVIFHLVFPRLSSKPM